MSTEPSPGPVVAVPANSLPLSAPPPPRRKRWIALSAIVLILLVGGTAGVLYWLHARQFEETDDAFVDGNVVPVSSQVAGRIKTVLVMDNQDVGAGDALVEIDDTDFVTRVTQAQSALEAAQARLQTAKTNVELVKANTAATSAQADAGVEGAKAGVVQAQADVEQAKASVSAAEAQVQSAQADVEASQAEAGRRAADIGRMNAVDPRAMSQQQRDAARAAADASDANLSATKKRTVAAEAAVVRERAALAGMQSRVTGAQAKVTEAQAVVQAAQTSAQQIATAESQVKTALAAVDQAQAELTGAQQQKAYAKIVAAVPGRVTRKTVEPGQYVDAGRNLLSIVQAEVWVTANFKETQLAHMHNGQAVEIWVDAYPGRVFKGKIGSIQAGTGSRFSLMPPENATGNFVKVVQRVPVKILFDEPVAAKQLLGVGMSAVPRVRVAGDEGAPEPIAVRSVAGPSASAAPDVAPH